MSGEGLFARLADRLVDEELATPAFTMADLLEMPAAERTVLRHVMRRAASPTLQQLAEELAGAVADLDGAVSALVEREAIIVEGDVVTVASIALNRRATPGGLWDRLGNL
ncbi:MAG: hypothetical protein RI958_818 [Actinomycetota bacterium]|jgi:hypothetical protein